MIRCLATLAGISAVVCMMLSLTGTAQAYIDPGAGSLLLQLVMGGIAGAFVVLKVYWKGLLGRFGVGRQSSGEGGQDDGVK